MRGAPLAAVALVLLAAGCAPKAPPAVVVAPRYPAFLFPGVPAQLAADGGFAARHEEGWRHLQTGDLRAAERAFRGILQQRPAFFPSEAALGYVSLARKEYKEALQHFELSLLVAPWYVPAMAGRGEAQLGLGRTADALGSFEAALAGDPSLTDLRARVESLRFRAMEDQVAAARRARDAGRYAEAALAYERAIAASPESGFLYRELAVAEQRQGQPDAALRHARRAIDLDPSDARAHAIAGEVLEAQQQMAAALAEYEAAAAIEPGEEIAARIERVRERIALAELPLEYHVIAEEPAITRAQLAALIGVRLADALQQAPPRPSPVMTDTRGSWAAPWIGSVVRAGVMDPYPNHTFQPHATIRRADLALAISRLLGVISAEDPKALQHWRDARPRFGDLPATHLGYPAAAMAVGAAVLEPTAEGAFQPTRPVSGAEAIAALDRLDRLWRTRRARVAGVR